MWRITKTSSGSTLSSRVSSNTLIYATLTSGSKVVLGLILGVGLCAGLRTQGFLQGLIYLPNILSTLAVGLAFSSLMHPTKGLLNVLLSVVGVHGPDWLGNAHLALYSVIALPLYRFLNRTGTEL